MTDSSPVFVRTTLKARDRLLISNMIWEAVNEALTIAAARIEALALSDVSQVPVDTGLLRSSFKIAISPGQLFMHWSAIDKGFDYARVQDVGRANMVGKYYSDVMKMQAHEIVHEELVAAHQRYARRIGG